jgi:hypothetical protein
MTPQIKRRLAVGAAVAGALAGAAALGLAGTGAVNADPYQYNPANFKVVGSDTTQGIMNALAGREAGISYTPLATSTGEFIVSFDATQNGTINTCIETKTGAPSFYRPNGSSEGRRALSRAIDGANYGIAGCGIKSVSGLIDVARSSAGPASGTSPATEATFLVYVPLGRDALSWAYANTSGAIVTDLTQGQLDTLFTSGPAVLDPDGAGPQPTKLLVPCGIQTGSGTKQSWDTAVGVTVAEEAVGTAFCNSLLGVPDAGGRLQESKADQLRDKADILAVTSNPICDGVAGGAAVSCAGGQVISGYSASGYIAARNGVRPDPNPIPENVFLGDIGGVSPLDGSGNPGALYNSTVFGRDVYNVLPDSTALDPFNGPVQEMFIDTDGAGAGDTALICQATTTIQTFGFLPVAATCGSTTLTANKLTGVK